MFVFMHLFITNYEIIVTIMIMMMIIIIIIIKVWVDARFVGARARLADAKGWIDRAFVAHLPTGGGGQHLESLTGLIRSAHLVSKNPIVVVNFGVGGPEEWSPEAFPRLLLLHAAPLPPGSGRGESLNSLRAVLLSRVRVGMAPGGDCWLSPGVDSLFPRVQQEVTRAYPFPILPAHFLDKGPASSGEGSWWRRYCPGGAPCRLQTTRWGHSQPAWTFWALPFFGRWLGRNFGDETLRPRADMEDLPSNKHVLTTQLS